MRSQLVLNYIFVAEQCPSVLHDIEQNIDMVICKFENTTL